MKNIPRGLNAFFCWLQKHDVPGKYRFYENTKLYFSERLICHHIAGSPFRVPWDQWCFWKNYGPENYYLEEIKPFTEMINRDLGAFDFFDLGADVGVVSALVNKYCDKLNRIYAFEPNPVSYDVLAQNIQAINLNHQAYNQAVSDFSGRCHLEFAQEQGSDHEGHIDKNKKGSTQVTSLDDFSSNHSFADEIVVKIDVEGQEIATLNGAHQTLTIANKVILFIELHPDVLSRDGQSPEEIFQAAEAIRDFVWLVPLMENRSVDRTYDFYDQFPRQQYDIIGISS